MIISFHTLYFKWENNLWLFGFRSDQSAVHLQSTGTIREEPENEEKQEEQTVASVDPAQESTTESPREPEDDNSPRSQTGSGSPEPDAVSREASNALSVDSPRHEEEVTETGVDQLTEEEHKTMNDLDENGWAHVHHAAYRGFVKSVERFVKANEDQLELETGDDLQSTPMLLSVMSGNLETVQCLVQLGAQVSSHINNQSTSVPTDNWYIETEQNGQT